jgi:hypothetical protein
MRYSSLFRSRWLALLWSAGIVWMAIDVASSQEPNDDVSANGAADGGAANLNELQALVGKLKSS